MNIEAFLGMGNKNLITKDEAKCIDDKFREQFEIAPGQTQTAFCDVTPENVNRWCADLICKHYKHPKPGVTPNCTNTVKECCPRLNIP